MGSSEWMTVADAAKELGVNDSRVRQLCLSGDLAAQKFGKVWMVSAEAVKDRAKNPPPSGRRW
jgi:excisionase family DNA binding protein